MHLHVHVYTYICPILYSRCAKYSDKPTCTSYYITSSCTHNLISTSVSAHLLHNYKVAVLASVPGLHCCEHFNFRGQHLPHMCNTEGLEPILSALHKIGMHQHCKIHIVGIELLP